MDPLFKKASADFDEGGAKGLLLNHLAIDPQGRIVFDSSDDTNASTRYTSSTSIQDSQEINIPDSPINERDDVTCPVRILKAQDMETLRTRFFPQLESIDDQDVCPSLKDLNLGDPSAALNIPFLKETDEQNPTFANEIGTILSAENVLVDGGFDIPLNMEFGQGGEAWARDAALEPNDHMESEVFSDIEGDNEEELGLTHSQPSVPVESEYSVGLGGHMTAKDSILSYFDNTLRKNWAGPENWKVRRIKDSTRLAAAAPRRRERELCEIDFLTPLDSSTADTIYAPAVSMAAISMPKATQRSKSKNLLPDDKHFNSRQLLELFIKPRAQFSYCGRLSRKKLCSRQDPASNEAMDEAYWAQESVDAENVPVDAAAKPDYDANFFQDDPVYAGEMQVDDEDEFADTQETFSPGAETDGKAIEGTTADLLQGGEGRTPAFGSQLVTHSNRVRPEYVQYAKAAKKVDVRRLKEEIWKEIGSGKVSPSWLFEVLFKSLKEASLGT